MYFNKLYIDDIIGFSDRRGTDKGLFREFLTRVSYDHHARTGYDAVEELLGLAVELTKDDCFGLHLGEYYLLKATESVNKIMQSSMDIEEAFSNAVQFSRMISDAMDCELVTNQQYFSVTFKNNPDWEIRSSNARKHNLDAALVSSVKSLQTLTGGGYYPSHVFFPYSRPKRINEYYRVFNCSLTFDHPHAEIQFGQDLLKKSIGTASFGLLALLKQKALAEMEKLGSQDDLLKKVKRTILQQINGSYFPSQQEVAVSLHMTVRTLQRQLSTLGHKYNEIVLDIKMSLATRYLREEEYKVDEISFLLGYSEASAFIRAFRKQMGVAPGKFVK